MEDPAGILHDADRLHLQQRFDDAAAAYRRALALDDAVPAAWYGLGHCLLALRSHGAAADALAHAVALRPELAGARCNLAEALFQLGRVDEAVRHYTHVAEGRHPEAARIALEALACLAPGAPMLDNAAVLAWRRRWVASLSRAIRPLPPRPRAPDGKLRVGYVSAFFGDRNWMKPVFGVINHHDRDHFEVHMLSDGAEPSKEAGYVDHDEDRIWQTNNLSNEELAGHIAAAGLDVLVDLNGYSAQKRLPLFLYRPAHSHIGWFNMFATTGMDAFDYLIGDHVVLAPGDESDYSEKLVRLGGCYLAFGVGYPVPEVSALPCLDGRPFTFGSLASMYKLTPQVIAVWSRVLTQLPASRLLLRNQGLRSAANRQHLAERFARHGIGEDRLQLQGPTDHFEFLQTYDSIDLALDPWPYNGGTTTSEALWQGVPVASIRGDRWTSRVSASILLAAGLTEFIAADADDLVRLATETAANPNRLATVRRELRNRLRLSAACDTIGLTRQLEAAYQTMAKQ